MAIPTGRLMASLLVEVINQRSFGWTIQMNSDPGIYIQGMIMALLASLLAGILPARRLGRMPAVEAIRYE
jgi:putative ABC transport system permease protein